MALADAFKEVGRFEDQIIQRVSAVVEGGELHHIAAKLFVVLALTLFVFKCMSWALRGFRLDELVHTVVRIMLTGFMLASFTVIVPAAFNAALFVGQVLLAGITGIAQGSPEALTLPTTFVEVLVRYGVQISPNCHLGMNPFHVLACIKEGAITIVAALAISVVLTFLCIAILLVDIWGFWLYAIALAIGPVLLPFTLYERLAFLFEGWLRFFFGTVIYIILARVNLALVAVAIMAFWGSTPSALGSFTVPTLPPIDDITNILGLMLFASVGIFTLLATGRFASTVVAGAAAGGLDFGRAFNAVSRAVQPRSHPSSNRGTRTRTDGSALTRGRIGDAREKRGNGFMDTRPDFADTLPDPDRHDTVPMPRNDG